MSQAANASAQTVQPRTPELHQQTCPAHVGSAHLGFLLGLMNYATAAAYPMVALLFAQLRAASVTSCVAHGSTRCLHGWLHLPWTGEEPRPAAALAALVKRPHDAAPELSRLQEPAQTWQRLPLLRRLQMLVTSRYVQWLLDCAVELASWVGGVGGLASPSLSPQNDASLPETSACAEPQARVSVKDLVTAGPSALRRVHPRSGFRAEHSAAPAAEWGAVETPAAPPAASTSVAALELVSSSVDVRVAAAWAAGTALAAQAVVELETAPHWMWPRAQRKQYSRLALWARQRPAHLLWSLPRSTHLQLETPLIWEDDKYCEHQPPHHEAACCHPVKS